MIKLDDIKIGGNNNTVTDTKRFDSKDLTWDLVPEGKYNATLAIVYPWKDITRDTNVRKRDADGNYVRNADGTFIMEPVKDVTWSFTDIVFRIDGGDYDGYAVKGNLSTHPNAVGRAKQFLYNANLFDVSLADLFKHTGTPVIVNVKVKDNNYTDKLTGLPVSKKESYASYYDKMSNDIAGL